MELPQKLFRQAEASEVGPGVFDVDLASREVMQMYEWIITVVPSVV